MIKLKFESAGHPDYFKIEEVEMNKEYSVSEFIKDFLGAYSDRNGTIKINNCLYDYKEGKLVTSVNPVLSNRIVRNVKGISGYSFLDIELILNSGAQGNNDTGSKRFDVYKLLEELSSDISPIVEKYEKILGVRIFSVVFNRFEPSAFSTDYKDGECGVNLQVEGR